MSNDAKKLKEFMSEHKFEKKRHKYANKHYFNNHTIFGSIKTKTDVEISKNYALNTIEMLKKNFDLVEDNIVDVEMAVGRYEIAVQKVIQLNQDRISSDFDYTVDEMKLLVDKIYEYHNDINKIRQRKLYQD